MKFRTEVNPAEAKYKIEYGQKIISLGSCFAESIGRKLLESKMDITINPLGILFNPLSVATGLQAVLRNRLYEESELVERNGLWHSFDHHSSFSSSDKNKTLDRINTALRKAHNHIGECKHLIMTMGTAWGYEHIERKKVVANCHKFPNEFFEKRLISSDEMVIELEVLLMRLKEFNPDIKVIFTVSPVRHWKDGASENTVSKASLILGIRELVNRFKWVEYFPAYEIVIDDLRDYRFYKSDMLHPSDEAVDYVWEKFCEAYTDDDTRELITEVGRLNRAMAHKIMTASPEERNKYREFLHRKISEIESRHHALDFSAERDQAAIL